MDAFITDSARKHGEADHDIWNCYRNPYLLRRRPPDGNYVIAYGTDLAGNLMAVGFVIRDDGLDVIIHALPGETPSD